ncbi:hypothetical protein HBJ58_02770 [Halomonas desiderata]|uniref:hypothetical protein n=1 Tax=Billgrantia desiderata TaxID=52021 RepID=UPI00174BD9B0|nr:hypothetical protein [Halomonas desiderata]MCE8010378.1 hypothetical protein [Halomonas desiderata]NIC35591.1 hypothetical protein [Halomonas desiderata]
MWFIQPKQDYVAQMPWKHADEPALMAWQIRTRDYYTLPANILFFVMLVISLGAGYLLSHAGQGSLVASLLWGGGMFTFCILIIMSITHQTSIIAYRLTEERIEAFSWKPQIDSVKPVMTWTAIGSGVVVLFLVFIDPAFLIAAIGPVGIGIAAALMGTSKNYRTLVRDDQHYEIDWKNTEEIAVWRKRRLIGLRFTWYNDDGSHYSVYSKVYFRKHDFEKCVDFFRERLPQTPYREERLVVHSHFATLAK